MFMPELKIFLLLLLMDEYGNRQEFENLYNLILLRYYQKYIDKTNDNVKIDIFLNVS